MKKRMFVIMVLVSFLAAQVFAAQSMKIAVAAADKTATAAVVDQPASAPYFLIFDEKGKLLEAIENPYKNAENPGPEVIDFLAGKGATIVVAGFFGPKIIDIAKAKGVTPLSFKGTAQDAVTKALKSNKSKGEKSR
jgi:predicted Fe-Mo cluster-binding NifX family protein